ncbi:MAG: hypothetical protein ACKOZT_00785 [Cyanobium sp.]
MHPAQSPGAASAAPKWRLLVKVVPLTLLFGLAKLLVHSLGLEPWEFDSLTGSLFGASTFVLAFVLAFVLSGTLSNYNASEDMVLQAVQAIESIDDISRYAARVHPAHSGAALRSQLGDLLLQLRQWLMGDQPYGAVTDSLEALSQELATVRQESGDSVSDRALPELARLRLLITKIALNRDTDFLGPAYAILEIFLVGVVGALLLIGADRFSENLVVSCFLFTSFTYLLLLIRDLDNPFQYDGSSCVDVDLTVVDRCRQRLMV